jgi:hypothetical protein
MKKFIGISIISGFVVAGLLVGQQLVLAPNGQILTVQPGAQYTLSEADASISSTSAPITLTQTPKAVIGVFRNGVRLAQTEYKLAGATITVSSSVTGVTSTDSFQIVYLY